MNTGNTDETMGAGEQDGTQGKWTGQKLDWIAFDEAAKLTVPMDHIEIRGPVRVESSEGYFVVEGGESPWMGACWAPLGKVPPMVEVWLPMPWTMRVWAKPAVRYALLVVAVGLYTALLWVLARAVVLRLIR